MKLIGIDIGTSTICGVLYDTATGRSESLSKANDTWLNTIHPWERMQDANRIVDIVKQLIDDLMPADGHVAGIGFTGQMHGIVYLDGAGHAVSPLYTWQDGRAGLDYKEGKSYATWMREVTGMNVSAGYGLATHFYNGMPGFHNVREFKHAGTVEAVYLMENMTVEMIADGIHVPPTLLKLVYHTKGVERTAMVTDALAVAASDSNKAFDPRVIIEDGVCKLADRSALAGSIATMDRLIATAVHLADIPLQDACRMVAETPARIMGVYDRKGSLQRGKDADILILDNDIKLHAVYCMGKQVNLVDKI